MESIDGKLAQRVWDRVNCGRETGPDANRLTALLSQELTDAAALLRLAKKYGGRGGDLLRLARQCRQHAGYLRGICSFVSGNAPSVAVPAPADSPVRALLRRCYVNSLHRMREYRQLAADPDYGPVFQNMANAMGHHCATLLELIGNAER